MSTASINDSPLHYDDDTNTTTNNNGIFPLWSRFTKQLHELICHALVMTSVSAARYPKWTIAGIPLLSFGLLAAGFFTNFELATDVFEVFAPFGAIAVEHKEWIDTSDFGGKRNPFLLIIHADGENIVRMEAIRRLMTAIDTVKNTTGFDTICTGDNYLDLDTCEVLSVGGFWGHNLTTFESQVHSDQDVAKALLGKTFLDGWPVDLTNYIDTVSAENAADIQSSSDTLQYARSFFAYVMLLQTPETYRFEKAALANVLQLREDWENEPNNNIKLEVSSIVVSPIEEMNQAIFNDLPLIPVVGFVMSAFTCLVFLRCDTVKSRTLLGVGSVITIGLSIMTGFGLMFLCGIPYTNMTTLLPFIVFGVGLDDTFIITGHFFRTDSRRDPLERLSETISTVGMSIFVTTLTTSLAFTLGLISNIPSIFWLCLYAIVTIIIDFGYQITFFTAILILDERRIQANRRDICICCTVVSASMRDTKNTDNKSDYDYSEDPSQLFQDEQAAKKGRNSDKDDDYQSVPDRFMIWFSNLLMRPYVKVLVIVFFGGLLGACIYSTTKLYQAFDATDLIPEDSYLRVFFAYWQHYQSRAFPVRAYFRDVDQSDPQVQEQMRQYIDDLVNMPQFGKQPEFCWVKDWPTLSGILPEDMSFHEKIDYYLQVPQMMKVYGRSIIRDDVSGNITASYCELFTYGQDYASIKDEINFLHEQRRITQNQPVNVDIYNPVEWSFFAYDDLFIMFEFYAVHVSELITTTIAGLVAVSAVTLLFLPHWSAVFFVVPIMMILYIDLIGTIQFAGLHMNVVTFVILVVSIGLLVDFVLHILLHYYESKGMTREEKAKDSLRTLGSSILVGGISTFLGVLPLAFSTSAIIQTVYICFLGMILLGVSHGLVLLPVLLSLFGPETLSSIPPILGASTSEGSADVSNEGKNSSDSDEAVLVLEDVTWGVEKRGFTDH